MPQLTILQRVWVRLEMARTNNACEVGRRWPQRWHNHPPPTKRAILKNFETFEREATCHNLNRGNSVRPRTARSPQNIQRIQQALRQQGERSSKRNGLGLAQSSFSCIARFDIRFHPCVLIRRQMLKAGDPQQRRKFCHLLLTQNPGISDELIVSDEAIFSLNSEINTRNVICYSEYGNGHPLDHYVEFNHGGDQVMVWVGLTRVGAAIGPPFCSSGSRHKRVFANYKI